MAIRKVIERATNNLFTNTEIGGTEAARMPNGTTAQRANEQTGDLRYNTDTGVLEQYTIDGWTSIAAFPVISSISPTSIPDSSSSFNITISGQSFSSNATVVAIGQNSSEISPTSVSRTSSSELVATFDGTSFSDAQEDYSIKVTNNTGLASTLSSALSVNQTPAFVTGNNTIISTVAASASISASITATDDEGDTLTFSSSDTPAWLTLNSDGTVTGTAPSYAVTGGANVDYTFNATVSDGVNTSVSRAFRVSVTGLNDSNTIWYIPFESDLVEDNNNVTPTQTDGSVNITTTGGYAGAYFNGQSNNTGAYLIYGNTGLSPLASVSAWTIEWWGYQTGSSSDTIIEMGANTPNSSYYQQGILLRHDVWGESMYWRGSPAFGSSGTFNLSNNAWRHYAMVMESSGRLSFWDNGTRQNSSTGNSVAFNGTPAGAYIGRSQHTQGNNYSGWLRRFRISNVARYTGNTITPADVYPIG